MDECKSLTEGRLEQIEVNQRLILEELTRIRDSQTAKHWST